MGSSVVIEAQNQDPVATWVLAVHNVSDDAMVPKLMTDPIRMAKRLSLAHCHAPVQPIQVDVRPVGAWNLEPAEEHRLFHRRSGSWAIEDAPLPASLLLRAGASLAIDVGPGTRVACLRFSALLRGSIDALAPLRGPGPGDHPYLATGHGDDDAITADWDALLAEADRCRAGDAWARPRVRGRVTVVVAATIADGFRCGAWRLGDERPDWVETVLARIEADLAKTIDLEALAGIASLSPSRFAHAFRDLVGQPPRRFIAERRLERAKTLLVEPGATVKRVAAACGFSDPEHFSVTFRKATGLPPSAWQQKFPGGRQPDRGRSR